MWAEQRGAVEITPAMLHETKCGGELMTEVEPVVLSHHIWAFLHHCLSGSARQVFKNTPRQDGLNVWRQLMLDYSDPPGVTGIHDEDYQTRFSAHMRARELWFREIFGETDPPESIMSPGDPKLSVNWPGGGILRFPPNPDRRHWVFATSGLAQPVHDEEFERSESSGWGIELVLPLEYS